MPVCPGCGGLLCYEGYEDCPNPPLDVEDDEPPEPRSLHDLDGDVDDGKRA